MPFRHGDCTHQVAGVGQHVEGLGFGIERGHRTFGSKRLRAELLHPLPGFGKTARHLVQAGQARQERDARFARQYVAVQLGTQRFQWRCGNDIRGDAVAGPDDQRGNQQQDVVATAFPLDHAAFRQGFGLLDEYFVAAQVGLGQVLQRGIHGVIVACAQQTVDDRGELGFPIAVFNPAARAVQRQGQGDKAGAVFRKTGSRGGARTGHRKQSEGLRTTEAL